MVDVIKALGFPYATTLPAASVRGLHESLINYGENKAPELLTCLHEEIAVGLAHGYTKVTGNPLLVLVGGTVGLQHTVMAVYNAWCDRVPVILVAGNHAEASSRRALDWVHSAQDNAVVVRDCTKWDDEPVSLTHFKDSMSRAMQLTATAPAAPVLLVVDAHLQEEETEERPDAIRNAPSTQRQLIGDPAALQAAASMLVNASKPLIIVDRYAESDEGVRNLVALAEALEAPVIDQLSRMNMPSRHYLQQSSRSRTLIREADVILGLELADFWGTVNSITDVPHRKTSPLTSDGAKLISIGLSDVDIRPNYQNFQRHTDIDLEIPGHAEKTLPYLIEGVGKALESASGNREARNEELTAAFKDSWDRERSAAAVGWDAIPISVARMCAELGEEIKSDPWALVSPLALIPWPYRLWDFAHHHQHIGHWGGYGMGYTPAASVGAALAHRDAGRIAISIVGDGELMISPQSLWTAAHHGIPLLMVVHNNRAYNQEVMHVQRMASRHSRGIDRVHIGTRIDNPAIDFAKLAQSQGVEAFGPVTNPNELKATFRRAMDVVRSGRPALVDVISQPR